MNSFYLDNIVVLGLDTPEYMMTFAGIVTTLLTVQLPDNEVDTLINVLGDAFGLPEEMKMFLVEHYLPEVLNMRLIFSLISIKFN